MTKKLHGTITYFLNITDFEKSFTEKGSDITRHE
jgi:hypothetical protein